MVAWKVVMFPLLLAAAGIVWILVSPVLTDIIPIANMFIESGDMSVQTAEAIAFGLNIFQAIPGIVMLCFAVGLVVDIIYRGDEY